MSDYAFKTDSDWVLFSGQALPLDGGADLFWVPASWSDDDKEKRFGLYPVGSPDVPEGKVIAAHHLGEEAGLPVWIYVLADAPVQRPMVPKSVVQSRIIHAGKMAQAYAALTANPVYFAKWFAPDHPAVYCDDPDAVGLVQTLGLDPAEVLAP